MKPTIENLRNGLCAVRNDGTLEELNRVMKLAFNQDGFVAPYKFYWKGFCKDYTILPSFSVKEFLQPEFPRVMMVGNCRNIGSWLKRLVYGKIGNWWYAYSNIDSINELTDDVPLNPWKYAEEIEEEPTLELTLDQIAEKFNVSVDKLKIKK
jgi:hypothetical protein